MQGNLKQAIQYASQNPTSDFAKQLATGIKSGTYDTQAQQLGIDLTPIKQSSIGTSPTPAKDTSNLTPLGKATFNGINSVSDKLATGEINTAKALAERGKNLVSDTITAGQADQGKPLVDRVLGGISYGAKKSIETIAGGVGDILSNMISPFIPQKVKDVYGQETQSALTDIKSALNTRPTDPQAAKGYDIVHGFLDNILQKAKDNPQIADILSTSANDALNIASLGAGGATENTLKSTTGDVLKTAIDSTGNAIKQGSKALEATTAKIAENRATQATAKTATDSIIEAKKILNPSEYYSPSEKQLAYSKGNVSTSGKGIFSKDVINTPTTPQTETIANLVNEGKISSKNLPSQNIQAIGQEARIADSNINELVNRPELNKPFTGSTINKVYDSVINSAKKDLVFVNDSTEQKAYQAVVDVAKEEIAKQPFNSAGLRKGIVAFNARMERILGSDIYSGASESVANARLQAAKDMRKALNNFLADNLESPTIKKSALANEKVANTLPAKSTFDYGKVQGGSAYRAELQKEAQLLNARDEIAFRASKTIDKTKLAQWLKKHPGAKTGLRYGGIGLGGAVLGGGLLKELGL